MVVKEALANSLKDAQNALALENSLREKYQNPGAVDNHFGYDSPSKDKERSNGLHVHLCMVCKGEGREFTQYGALVSRRSISPRLVSLVVGRSSRPVRYESRVPLFWCPPHDERKRG